MGANGAILYRGPSVLDPSVPIVVVATGLKRGSSNGKTGTLLQTWILVDDAHPGMAEGEGALATGRDAAVCGDCPHRPQPGGSRTCYVQMRAPAAVWRAVHRGSYRDVSGNPFAIAALGAGRKLRLGSYGDPAAVPFWVWAAFVSRRAPGRSVNGYTHQQQHPRFDPRILEFCMVSADALGEAADGRRSFYVRPQGAPLPAGFAQCPAAEEAGRRVQCEDCMLCGGASVAARSISIEAHGATGHLVGRSLPLEIQRRNAA